MSAATVSQVAAPEAQAPPRRGKGRRWTSYILPLYTWIIIVGLSVPVFVMIVFSFNNPSGRQNIKWEGFTTKNYTQIMDQTAIINSIKLSLEIAVFAMLIATALGALLGLALGRYRFRGSAGVNYLVFLAIASPEIVLGTSLLTLFANQFTFIKLGIPSIVIAHVMFCTSFVAVTVRARVQGLNPSMEEAAQDLGANPVVTFMKVTLPLIMPGIIAGALLAFALSIDDFVITYFVSGSTTTFPLLIFGAAKTGITPSFNVIGTFLFTFGVLIALFGSILPSVTARRDNKRLAQDREASAEFLSAGAGH